MPRDNKEVDRREAGGDRFYGENLPKRKGNRLTRNSSCVHWSPMNLVVS